MNDTRAHVVNVKEGLVKNAFGKQILFETTSCLRLNQSSCFPPSHRLYGYTTHGLDALFNRFYEVLRVDLSDGGLAPWFNSAEFEYVDQTYPDFEGGESICCYNARTHMPGICLKDWHGLTHPTARLPHALRRPYPAVPVLL